MCTVCGMRGFCETKALTHENTHTHKNTNTVVERRVSFARRAWNYSNQIIQSFSTFNSGARPDDGPGVGDADGRRGGNRVNTTTHTQIRCVCAGARTPCQYYIGEMQPGFCTRARARTAESLLAPTADDAVAAVAAAVATKASVRVCLCAQEIKNSRAERRACTIMPPAGCVCDFAAHIRMVFAGRT